MTVRALKPFIVRVWRRRRQKPTHSRTNDEAGRTNQRERERERERGGGKSPIDRRMLRSLSFHARAAIDGASSVWGTYTDRESVSVFPHRARECLGFPSQSERMSRFPLTDPRPVLFSERERTDRRPMQCMN